MPTSKGTAVRLSVFAAGVAIALVAVGPAGASTQAGPWQSAASMSVKRAAGMMALLQNGHVLVAGGLNNATLLSSAEVYTPSPTGQGSWASTGALHAARQSGAAVTLFDGRVLVVGGKGAANVIRATAELYDPVAGTWSTTGSMSKVRTGMVATLLYNGKVLVAGGTDVGSPVDPLSTAELFDPATGTWKLTGSMATPRAFPTATLLPNGKVLVAGGVISADGTLTKTAELYDPTAGTWSSAASMFAARDHGMAALLVDGRAIVIGGQGSSGKPLGGAAIYSPGSNTWAAGGTFAGPRALASSDVLYSGKLVLAGGFGGNGNTVLSSADLYTPNGSSGTWTTLAAMPAARGRPMAMRLSNGKDLLAGGWADDLSSVSLQSAVLYAPDPHPSFNLAPGFGAPGATVRATGGGFTPNEPMKIYWESTVLATSVANGNGGFTVDVTIPADATVGGHIMKAVGQTSKRVAYRWFAVPS
jgi:N-acetylneuraminic acid mutarotase